MNDVEMIMTIFYALIIFGVLLVVRYFFGFEVAILFGIGGVVAAILAKEKE